MKYKSIITAKGQTTIPLEIRKQLNLKPQQPVQWEMRKDGTVILRPVPETLELFARLKPANQTHTDNGTQNNSIHEGGIDHA